MHMGEATDQTVAKRIAHQILVGSGAITMEWERDGAHQKMQLDLNESINGVSNRLVAAALRSEVLSAAETHQQGAKSMKALLDKAPLYFTAETSDTFTLGLKPDFKKAFRTNGVHKV